MAVHNGFDNRFYVNVWELNKIVFASKISRYDHILIYFHYVLLIFVWWQHYLSKGQLARLLMNQDVMRICQLFIVAIGER